MVEKRRFRITQGCTDSFCHDWRNDYLLDFGETVELLNELHEENERLKQTMHEVAGLLSEEVDLFSDKAIEHDINAYRELIQLDNKDAFYMAKATKTAIKMLKR